jgi:Holliday junction resolvase-like predicted endonuclease
MSKKPFSQSLYEDDDNAKDQIIKWLNINGWKASTNPDKFGIDVIALDINGHEHYFEVEVKHNWKGPTFQYDTLHYSARKRKFLNDPDHTTFITLNHERTHALIVAGKTLADAPDIIKDTIYTKGESFIEVKTSNCTVVDLGRKVVSKDREKIINFLSNLAEDLGMFEEDDTSIKDSAFIHEIIEAIKELDLGN